MSRSEPVVEAPCELVSVVARPVRDRCQVAHCERDPLERLRFVLVRLDPSRAAAAEPPPSH